jgi:hypothetical protein
MPLYVFVPTRLPLEESSPLRVSGGSLPSLLASLPNSFDVGGYDASFDVILADEERCVPSTHVDSNGGAGLVCKKNKTERVDSVHRPGA